MRRTWLVTWEVEVDAVDARDAVDKARALARAPGRLQTQVGWTAADLRSGEAFEVDVFMDKTRRLP